MSQERDFPCDCCDTDAEHDAALECEAAYWRSYFGIKPRPPSKLPDGQWRHHGNTPNCDDCGAPATTTFGLGAVRCDTCAANFQQGIRITQEIRDRRERADLLAHQRAGCPDDGVTCPLCCEHEFDASEGYHCLNCGTDGSEDVMAAAYDRAKDARKYG